MQCEIYFFFNETATTEICTLSLHDALPICVSCSTAHASCSRRSYSSPSRPSSRAAYTAHACAVSASMLRSTVGMPRSRSEEHTSELQSRQYLVCRLLLEKKKEIRRAQGVNT